MSINLAFILNDNYKAFRASAYFISFIYYIAGAALGYLASEALLLNYFPTPATATAEATPPQNYGTFNEDEVTWTVFVRFSAELMILLLKFLLFGRTPWKLYDYFMLFHVVNVLRFLSSIVSICNKSLFYAIPVAVLRGGGHLPLHTITVCRSTFLKGQNTFYLLYLL